MWDYWQLKEILITEQLIEQVSNNLNMTVDQAFLSFYDKSKWKLPPKIFSQIFPSRMSQQVPVYITWNPDMGI